MQRPSLVDLFCGAGGLSLGFQQEGYVCAAAIEQDPTAVRSYARNFNDHIACEVITTRTDLPEADVIIGGPPCQGFSSAGMRREDDSRNTLVRVFAEIVATRRPKAFVFENVEGFLTSANGERIIDLLEPVLEVGYRVHLRKVNAANYGVPQHRKRVIAIGAVGFDLTFPQPTHMAFGAPGASIAYRHLPRCTTFADAVDGLPPPATSPPGNPDGHFVRPVSKDDAMRMRLLTPGQRMRDLPEHLWHSTYKKRAFRRVMDGTPSDRRGGPPAGLRRLQADAPCKAITSGAISEFVHPTEDRYLTLRECARIQTFPDSFVFEGTVGQISLQIGNAVPPRLARVIAATLRADIAARSEERVLEGALLSFLPTLSTGMSPALSRVCERIRDRFQSSKTTRAEQSLLWS